MKKIFYTISLFLTFVLSNAQKTSGTIRDTDDNSNNVKALYRDYTTNTFSLWNSLLADNAVIYVNNNKLPKDIVIQAFKGHHGIFNDIQIIDTYAHTNYFKRDEVWSNSWFIWMGTGNKTGIRYANRSHFDFKWDNGKIVELLCYFDTASLNNEMNSPEN